MSFESVLAYTIGIFMLALVPGVGLATILSRTFSGGLKAGYAVTFGLTLGDFVFMGLAILGLSAIANTFGPAFQIIKYAGAAYLIYLGVQMFRGAGTAIDVKASEARPVIKDIALGLFVTLGNPKPILFYGALLPTFFDMTKIGFGDYLVLWGIVVVVSALVYGVFMLLAERSRRLLASTKAVKRLNQACGTMLIGSGVAVATR